MRAPDSLLAALDKLVLERQPDGRFVRLGMLPAWCAEVRPDALRAEGPIEAEVVFPFLEAFVPIGERAWAGADGSCVGSEFWTEVSAGGEEIHLEAAALRLGASRLLVITRNERLYRNARLVLQRARELRLSHQSLTREIERKDVLVHAIVHDLSTPLHGMLGTLSLLAERPLPEPHAGWIRLALDSAIRQRQMIEEILDVFVAEAGALQATPDPSVGPELGAVLRAVGAELESVARRRDVRIEVAPEPGVCPVVGERERLFRVLANLLDNALRHSPARGRVRIGVRREPDAAVVTVEDEGSGVPADVVPRLFQKFGRGRGGASRTGLGLYFCRITVERWGGRIGYEARAGGGARFWVRLRLAEREAERGEALAGG